MVHAKVRGSDDDVIIYVCRDDANMVMDKMFLEDEPRPWTLRLVFWKLRPVFV
jgi:hypothetical protein